MAGRRFCYPDNNGQAGLIVNALGAQEGRNSREFGQICGIGEERLPSAGLAALLVWARGGSPVVWVVRRARGASPAPGAAHEQEPPQQQHPRQGQEQVPG